MILQKLHLKQVKYKLHEISVGIRAQSSRLKQEVYYVQIITHYVTPSVPLLYSCSFCRTLYTSLASSSYSFTPLDPSSTVCVWLFYQSRVAANSLWRSAVLAKPLCANKMKVDKEVSLAGTVDTKPIISTRKGSLKVTITPAQHKTLTHLPKRPPVDLAFTDLTYKVQEGRKSSK